MKTVAVFNMKGGVGKTTTAVNLSYLAATAGQRTLLWDLDPQAASTFAFRVRPHVPGFGTDSVTDGRALEAAIKETDYENLHLLPANFAYRKFERILDSLAKPKRLVASLLDTIGHDFDTVFLDCPAGFSLLVEAVLAAADAILVPVVPNVLSLRTVVRLIKWADRSDATTEVAAFLNMVDRRKTLHRRAGDLFASHPDLFLTGQVPYASVVEQMGVRRMPLPTFAGGETATAAFAEIWAELQTRLRQGVKRDGGRRDRWGPILQIVESLIEELDCTGPQASDPAREALGPDRRGVISLAAAPTPREEAEAVCVHRFDTEGRDLEQHGYLLELRECRRSLFFVAAESRTDQVADPMRRAQARVDALWALEILAGEMSPLAALDRRLGRPGPRVVEDIHVIVDGRALRRIETRQGTDAVSEGREGPPAGVSAARPRLVHPLRPPSAQSQHEPLHPGLDRDRATPGS